MLLQHHLVIHFVDVVPGEQHDESGAVGFDDIDVLIDGVRRPEIPACLGNTLAGRQDIETLVALGPEKVPAHLQMTNEAMRLVLGGDRDPADAGIQCVGQGEIDNSRLATEEHGGLRPFRREIH